MNNIQGLAGNYEPDELQDLVDRYEPWQLLGLLAAAFTRAHNAEAAKAALEAAHSVDPEYQRIPF